MACECARQRLSSFLRDASLRREAPKFLVPSVARHVQRQQFSSSSHTRSRIGRSDVTIPPDVSLRFFDLPTTNARSRKTDTPRSAVEVKGPLGELTLHIPPYLQIKHNEETKKVSLNIEDSTVAHQRAMWGTMRSHLQNYVTGVSEGHVCILRLVGVGYRASIEKNATTVQPEYEGQEFINLKLGFAHPVEMPIPQSVKASIPQPTRILLEGPNKEVVTKFAAEIRRWRQPEPYKGKGIYVNDETIKLKAKKIK